MPLRNPSAPVRRVAGKKGKVLLVVPDIGGLQAELDGLSPVGHDHDDLYYRKFEVDDSLSFKSEIGHTHVTGEILDAGSAATRNVGSADGNVVVLETGGKIPLAYMPATVINDTFPVRKN